MGSKIGATLRLLLLPILKVITHVWPRFFDIEPPRPRDLRPYLHDATCFDHGRHLPLSVIVADVDGSGATNDYLGHRAGKEVMRPCGVFRDGFSR